MPLLFMRSLTLPSPRLSRLLAALMMILPWSLGLSDEPDATLDAEFWVGRCDQAAAVILDRAAVDAANRRVLACEPSVIDLGSLPESLPRDTVVSRIATRSTVPTAPLFLADGTSATTMMRLRWQEAASLDAVPDTVTPRYGLVVCRTPLRRFPTRDRVHLAPGEWDIDLFQESAFFPGTPVAAVHTTSDGRWCFVIGPTYDAWVEADHVAFGPRETVLDYAARASRTVTGSQVKTAFTPDCPAVSEVVLDMGSVLPERRSWPIEEAVNGQSAVASFVVEMPLRQADGSLRIVPALLPRSADTHDGPLPATRGHVLRQAFKFLGERYGWGHDFNGRDCSGFVSDVYRSVGILLPRNTRDQSVCPAFARTPVAPEASRADRVRALAALRPGDLIYLPRHVMMVVGHDEHGTWVIHDTHGRDATGMDQPGKPSGRPAAANGVVVSPMVSLESPQGRDAIDAITMLLTILPHSPVEDR
jgi:cell wall-associated NlpC family hydrolase